MNYTRTEELLIEAMESMEVVDAHEHLPPEHVRMSLKMEVVTFLSSFPYARTDLTSAGMKPLDERWKLLSPYLEHIRYGSYARPGHIALKEFYGFDEVTDNNYREVSGCMQSQNTPGIYHRVMREKCKIRVALTQTGSTDYDDDLFIPLMPLQNYTTISSAAQISRQSEDLDMKVANLDDYLELAKKGIKKWKSEGAVGLKMASVPNEPPDRKTAEERFNKIMSGSEQGMGVSNPLQDFLTNYLLDFAGELDLVVAVHAGMWGDFRNLDSRHMISVFPRHPNTRFDLYHLGMPSVRETIVIGKNFGNVWLNLCGCHIISQQMTCSALDECIDLVPMNKIIGFGADYGATVVEKVYGHLVMARENIATVLGRRVDRGLMSYDEAVALAQKWLWDNPKNLYKLDI